MLSIQDLREKRAAKALEYRQLLDSAGDNFNNQRDPARRQDAARIDALSDESRLVQ